MNDTNILHIQIAMYTTFLLKKSPPFFLQTSFTLSWACYLLARHPQIQQQIFTEVTETLGPGAVATADDVPRLPLIRGLVKETLRYRLHEYLYTLSFFFSIC